MQRLISSIKQLQETLVKFEVTSERGKSHNYKLMDNPLKLVLDKPIVSSDTVGLSYSYQSHRTYITISTNKFTGECKVHPKTLATTPKKQIEY